MLKRFFSVVKPRKLPSWLGNKLETEFAKYPPDAAIASNSQITRNANKIYQELELRSKQGCEDSKDFIDGLEEFRKPSVTALPITNIPKKDIRVIEYLSRIVASIFNPKLRLAEKIVSLQKKSHFQDIFPHSDGSTNGHELELTQVSGIISDGSISTYVMNIKDLYDQLPEQSQKALKEPIFGYTSEPLIGNVNKSLLSLKLPIFYEDTEGNLKINLFYDSRPLLQYDENKTSFSEIQIETALEQLHNTINNFLQEDKIKKFYIKEGDTLSVKNKYSLHGVINESGLFNPKKTFDPQEPISHKTHREVLIVSHENPIASPTSPEFHNLVRSNHNHNTKKSL